MLLRLDKTEEDSLLSPKNMLLLIISEAATLGNSTGSRMFLTFVSVRIHLLLILMMNIVPFPTVDWTLTVPPCCSMMFLQIDNPRPVPSLLR